MVDTPTDMPGVKLRRIRGQLYVVAYTQRLGNPDISDLAQIFRLQPERVLHVLLRYKANRAAVRALHRDHCRGIDEDFPGFGKARRDLQNQAYNMSASNSSDRLWWVGYAFLKWELNLEEKEYVLLPLSQGFRKVLRGRQRQARIRTVTPSFQALEQQLKEIRMVAIDLDMRIGLFKSLTEQSAKDIAILEALDGLLGVLLSKKGSKSPLVDSSDRTDVEVLQRKLKVLKERAYQNMIHDPPNTLRQNLVRERDQLARKLMKLVQDSDFVKNIRTLIKNLDVAPPELYLKTTDTLRQAATVLLLSPQADSFVDNHVIPLIDTVSSKPFDTKGLKTPKHPQLERVVLNPPAAPSSTNSAFVLIVGVLGVGSKLVGNSPGPSSLSVCIVELSAPIIMQRIVNPEISSLMRGELSTRYAGRLYRFLVNSAGLGQNDRVNLIQAIDNGDLGKEGLRKVKWSNKLMNSPVWRAAMGISASICLIAAITADDANTLRYWANIVDSASGTAWGVSVALSRYSTLIQNGVVKGIGGKALGVVGGLAAIVVGTETAIEEYQTSDNLGMGIAIAGAAAGALSVAGFLIATGAATSGVGVGVILMAAGAIIGIAAGLVALIRQLTTKSSHLIFEAFINHFGECYEYTKAAESRAVLRQAFKTVQSDHHGADFWYASPDRSPDLFDVGFTVEHIAQIVDEDKVVVVDHILTMFVKTKSHRTKNKTEYYKDVAKKLDSEPQYIKNRLGVIGAKWNENLKTFTKP